MTTVPVVDVRRAADRACTTTPWLESKHSFAFGRHYDPANTHHGLLLVNNEDVVLPGAGFETHPHRDMEILTWVLSGSLEHRDSAGHTDVIYPGLAQRMSAGTGVLHSERNAGATDDPVHFLQMWVLPDEHGTAPGYEQLDVADQLASGGLIPIASGRDGHDAAIRIRNRSAALHAARLESDEAVSLPAAPYLHLFVGRGTVALEGVGELAAGDAVRLTASGGQRLTAVASAEVLVWEMHSTVT